MSDLGISLGWSPRESADRLVQLVNRAEGLGVSACWVIDSQTAMRDAFALLTMLAGQTSSILMGPGVTNLVTRHETVVANSLATLASVAPGRVLAGLGAGDSAVFPIGLRPQRIQDLRRGIERLRTLLTGEKVDGPSGPLRLAFPPDPPPPIVLAASQPRMLQLGGTAADGVIVMGPADVDSFRRQIDWIHRGADQANRDPGSIPWELWVTMAVGEEGETIRSVKSWATAQARWLSRWERLPASLEPFRAEMTGAAQAYEFEDHLSLSATHADVVSDELARRLAVVGSIDQCRERLSELVALGPSRVTVALVSGGRERRLEETVEVWRGIHELRGSANAGLGHERETKG